MAGALSIAVHGGGTRNLYWKPADGSGDEERLTTKPGVVHTPTSVSPDGQWLAFAEGGGTVQGTTWADVADR